jgi:hypothetical protein
MGQHRFLGQFQNRERMLASYCGEVLQEMIERIVLLKIVEKGLHRNSRTPKHHGAAHDFIRPGDHQLG